jgi:hypothetical protein
MAEWVDADTGQVYEEMVPKPKRPRRGAIDPDAQRKDMEEKGTFVSPKREESYPGPIEEPPLLPESELPVLEAAMEIFSDEMSPAERAKLEAEVKKVKPIPHEPSLHAKLVSVMAAVDAVTKKGSNTAQNYSYQRAVDVFNAVRPEFIKRGILFIANVTGTRTTVVDRGGGKAPNILADLEFEFMVTDGKDTFRWTGAASGIDAGDKGVFKAITGGMKYGVRQLLMLPDENDPEKTRPGEREDVEGPASINISSAKPVAVQQGGRQQNATSAQISAIREASRELMLSPEMLRTFIVSELGSGPDLDPGLNDNQQAKVLMDYLAALPFEECGKIVKGLMASVEASGGGS